MALYVLADLHLSFAADKPMDVFGGAWRGYVDKLREGLSVLREGDTLVVPGDLSWGISLAEALEDFRFLASYPGRKLLVKGNHDLWWDTRAKMERFLAENGTDRAVRHAGLVLRGGSRHRPRRQDARAGGLPAEGLPESGENRGRGTHILLRALPAGLRQLRLRRDRSGAGGKRRRALLVRASARGELPRGLQRC